MGKLKIIGIIISISVPVFFLAKYLYKKYLSAVTGEKVVTDTMGFVENSYPKNGIGYKQNNPLCIRATSIAWNNKLTPLNGFERFKTLNDGIIAGLKNLRTLIAAGHNTPKKLMNVYAPVSDNNNTSKYVTNVASFLSVTADTLIDNDNQTLSKLAAIISKVENGTQLSWTDISNALQAI